MSKWHIQVRENWYRDVWLLVISLVLVLIAIKAFDVATAANNAALVSNSTLCSFRKDVDKRINATQSFIITHPHGIPGISIGTLRVSLINTRATKAALAPIASHCNP